MAIKNSIYIKFMKIVLHALLLLLKHEITNENREKFVDKASSFIDELNNIE